jgi:hypothetical protein
MNKSAIATNQAFQVKAMGIMFEMMAARYNVTAQEVAARFTTDPDFMAECAEILIMAAEQL